MSQVAAVIDTSALIDLEDRYPRDVFGSVWQRIELEVSSGKLICPRAVGRELKGRSQNLKKWAKNAGLIQSKPDSKLDTEVRRISKLYPDLRIGERRSTPDPKSADEWVVALAVTRNFAVVSSERPAPQAATVRKIPDACRLESIVHFDLVAYFRQLGLKV